MKLKKSFTLVELLISIGIIGILVGVGIPIYNNYKEEVQNQVRYNQLKQIIRYMDTLLVSIDCPLDDCSKSFQINSSMESGEIIIDNEKKTQKVYNDIKQILNNLKNFKITKNFHIIDISFTYEDDKLCKFKYVVGERYIVWKDGSSRITKWNKPTLVIDGPSLELSPLYKLNCDFGKRLNNFYYN